MKICPLDYTAFADSGKIGIPVNRFNHTSWVAIVTPTDRPNSVRNRPKSVRNRCVIDIFGGVCTSSRCFRGLSVGVRAFVIGLSQLSSIFSVYMFPVNRHNKELVEAQSRTNISNYKLSSIHLHIKRKTGITGRYVLRP